MNLYPLYKKKFHIVIFIFFVCSVSSYAQEKNYSSSQEVIKLYNKSQMFYSSNDEIINGCVYPLPNSRIKGNPYLEDQWTEALLFVNNKKYTNLFIKYDLIIDDVILKADMGDGTKKFVNLNKFQVDSFIINNSCFINSRFSPLKDMKRNYYEKIYKGKYSLLKVYKKVFIKKYSNITPYGSYSAVKSYIYLCHNEQIRNVNRKSSFYKCFEEEKRSEIKSFIKKNNIKYRKATKIQLIELMNYCSNLTSK